VFLTASQWSVCLVKCVWFELADVEVAVVRLVET
jgi:hypothetical protein